MVYLGPMAFHRLTWGFELQVKWRAVEAVGPSLLNNAWCKPTVNLKIEYSLSFCRIQRKPKAPSVKAVI
ncbi:MAG: hypothetical protein JWQ14_2216 [Adhaeribacter sp.]|nr:hypothetical protein [Adhaeribacter sp.]